MGNYVLTKKIIILNEVIKINSLLQSNVKQNTKKNNESYRHTQWNIIYLKQAMKRRANKHRHTAK